MGIKKSSQNDALGFKILRLKIKLSYTAVKRESSDKVKERFRCKNLIGGVGW